MRDVGLIIAIKKTIMEGVAMVDFKNEYAQLTIKDKDDLVRYFNEGKNLGDDVNVVLKTV